MTKLEEQAFDWAADHCPCNDKCEDCIAETLMKAYVEGFKAGLASVVVDNVKESRDEERKRGSLWVTAAAILMGSLMGVAVGMPWAYGLMWMLGLLK